MARPAKPWWDKAKAQWACRHLGRYHPLGRGSRDDAERNFHRLKLTAPPKASDVRDCDTVAQVIGDYLLYVAANKAPRTHEMYTDALTEFHRWLGDMRVDDLKPADLQKWIDGKPTWSANTKRLKCRVVQQAFAWAVRNGLVERNPVLHFRKPPASRREGVIDDATWAALLALYPPGDPFVDVLAFCRLTGARPQEVRAIEARHVRPDLSAVVFPTSEAKSKKRPRTINLPAAAGEIVKRLAARRTTGPIFRNADGEPWHKDTISQRLKRAGDKLGVRLTLGMVRKTWETAALRKLPLAVVAELAGHDPATAMEYYSHLGVETVAMREASEAAVAQPKHPKAGSQRLATAGKRRRS